MILTRAVDEHNGRDSLEMSAVGEAFKSHFETPALHARLAALGFCDIEDLGPAEIRARRNLRVGRQ
jgi:hypothetical protein